MSHHNEVDKNKVVLQNNKMYHPKQSGFFPLIQLKIEEGLSPEDKQNYLKLNLLEKIQWIYDLPRFSSENEDNVLRQLCKLDFGIKSKASFLKNTNAAIGFHSLFTQCKKCYELYKQIPQ